MSQHDDKRDEPFSVAELEALVAEAEAYSPGSELPKDSRFNRHTRYASTMARIFATLLELKRRLP